MNTAGAAGGSHANDSSATPATGPTRGQWIVWTAWASNVVFVAGTAPEALGADSLGTVAAGVSLALFLLSLPVWLYALGRAVVRSAQGDEISVASLFFLSGSAPRRVRNHLLGATAVSVVVAALVAAGNPAAVLVPMLTLGLAGLWGSVYGTFPPRRPGPARGSARR